MNLTERTPKKTWWDNDNNNQDDIYSAVIMTTRSFWEFTRFIWWM